MTELVVTEDVAGTAVDRFLMVSPRLVSLAGGSTPGGFYERLAKIAYPWESVTLLLGDERCVPPDHPDSNRRMVEERLLARLPGLLPRVLWMPAEDCDAAGHERALRSAFGDDLRLDLAVLGVGEDGHTASLFPGTPALEETERWVVRVDRPDHPRLTLTLPVLSSASAALFLAAGPSKRDAVRRLLDGDDIPAARVRARQIVVIADPVAAG